MTPFDRLAALPVALAAALAAALGKPAPGARRLPAALTHPASLLAVLGCALLCLGLWLACTRPVVLPGFHGRVAGLDFSPFRRGQSPEAGTWPTQAQIRADLATAARISDRIRTYSVQGPFAEIPRLAAGLPLRITLGAWLGRDPAANRAEIARLVAAARGAPNVERVVVGNETLLRHDLTPDALIDALMAVRRAVRVPVTTAEPWHVWLAHPDLAAAVDVITIHLLPYWEGVPEDDALRFVLQKLDAVQAAYPDKKIVIGEVGWPSGGVTVGAARPGLVAQARFLRGFFRAAAARHLDYFVMEAFDQPWKTGQEGRVAGYWGMLDLGRHAKWPLTGAVQPMPGWGPWAGGGILGAALAGLLLLSARPDMRVPGRVLVAALAQGGGAALALMFYAMGTTYLSGTATLAWGGLAAAQSVLLALLLADGFDLAETVWGRVWRRVPAIVPAPSGARLPKVSLHLPVCNEPPHLVRQTLDALAALDYPDFEVLVIDNNTADPALWEPVAEHCARLGARFRFFHLGAWPGFKAGALNFALRETAADADVVGVLDSDYAVRPDWLRCMVPHFADARVGLVQSPQDYRDNDGSFFKRLMFWEYAGFFHLGMVNRNERNAIVQHGTMTLIRARALRDAGGWAEWCVTEDAELGLRLFRSGWQAVYSRRSFGRGVMPDDFAAWRRQRARWACGAMQICRRHAGALLNPFSRELTLGQRWHFLTGWLPWLGDALNLVFLLAGLAWSAALILAPLRTEFPFALFLLPGLGLFAFRLAQGQALYAARVPCGRADRLAAALAGLALSHTVGKAVWKGLAVRRAPFLRTPKLADAPALMQGLAMAWEEAVLLALTWAAIAGVVAVHGVGAPDALLWCAVLLTQSLPHGAAVVVALAAALPARRGRRLPQAQLPAQLRASAGAMLARTGAGD